MNLKGVGGAWLKGTSNSNCLPSSLDYESLFNRGCVFYFAAQTPNPNPDNRKDLMHSE